MNTRRSWWIALVLSALAAPLAARAQDDFGRTGPYLGLAGSLGIYTRIENELDDLGIDVDVEEPLGANARVGYRFHPHVSAEAEVEWLSDADIDVDGGGTAGNFQTITSTANAKAFLLTGRVQPFALIGLGAMVAEAGGDAEWDFAARFGLGGDIYITRNFYAALDVSYVLPVDDVEKLDFVSIGWGFGYRF